MKKLVFVFVSVLSLSCSKSPFSSSTNLSSDSSSQSAANGPGALVLKLKAPLSLDGLSGMTKISVEATPISQLKSLSLSINSVEIKIFHTLPLELDLNLDDYPGDLQLNLVSLDMQNKPNYLNVLLKRSASTGPLDCQSDNQFDTCLFFKNPVVQKKSPFSRVLSRGDDLSKIQTYGVKLTNQIRPDVLQSSSIRVLPGDGELATSVNGKWKFAYKDDAQKSFIAQLMAYYWLTFQEKEMEARAGVFYAKNRNISVIALDETVVNNAFWDGRQIVMGTANHSHEMALSAEVYLHEMGHANLSFAAQSDILNDANSDVSGNHCMTSQGCIGGINEGQADFHFVLLFPDNTALGETWVNSLEGLVSRNVRKNLSYTVTDIYGSSQGEIHSMGAIYAAILYSIYSHPDVVKADFEKLFSLHLQKLTGRTRFPEARDILIADDAAFFNSKYSEIIRQAFNSRGVSP